MKITLSFLIFIFLSSTLWSQSLTVEYLNDWVKLCNPDLDFDKKEKLYVVEGVPLQDEELSSELISFDRTDKFLFIDYLNSDSIESTFLKPDMIVILVGVSKKIKSKEAQERLKEFQVRYQDNYQFKSNHIMTDSKDPVLFINNEKIHHAEAKKVLDQLNHRKILNVISVSHAPATLYGQNAKNGLIKIWTKDQ